MLEIPLRLGLGIAEMAGEAVLGAWRLLVPVLLAARSAVLSALRVAERELTPARALAAVALAALATIAIAEFSDYRAVGIGSPDYSGVESVAPAPRVDERTAGSAHSNLLLPLALGGGVVLVLSMRGRWRLARLLTVIGLTVVAVSLLNDLPQGLDEGDAAVKYEGAKATLLGPFWAQLAGGAVLVFSGLLLAPRIRDQNASGSGRSVGLRRGPTGLVAGQGAPQAGGAGT
jgi:hypothetical protein